MCYICGIYMFRNLKYSFFSKSCTHIVGHSCKTVTKHSYRKSTVITLTTSAFLLLTLSHYFNVGLQ